MNNKLAPSRVASLATGALLVLVSACTSSTDPETAKSPTHDEATVVTMQGPVEAGTYRVNDTTPRFEITLDGEDWFAGKPHDASAWFNLYPSDPSGWVQVSRPSAIYDDKDSNPDPMPADFVAWLRSRPQLLVIDPVQSELDDRPALRFDVSVMHPDATCQRETGDVACVRLAAVPGDAPLEIATGERVRFWVLDFGEPVIVTMAHRVDGFDNFSLRAQPVVQSIRFLDD